MPQFLETERSIIELFRQEEKFFYKGEEYTIDLVGKANAAKGDPKTDVYISAKNTQTEEPKEFKISIKQTNADFLENKITADRAQQIFGDDWKELITETIQNISSNFSDEKLIYKTAYGKNEKGMYKLGWRLDIINKPTGNFTVKLSPDLLKEVLTGESLSIEKRNANVEGETIENSGIANYIITVDVDNAFTSVDEIMNHLLTIDEYIDKYSDTYLTCRSINLRTMPINKDTGLVENKIKMERRHFVVFPKWKITDSKLDCELCFDEPFTKTSAKVQEELFEVLKQLNINSVDDLNSDNVLDCSICYHKE